MNVLLYFSYLLLISSSVNTVQDDNTNLYKSSIISNVDEAKYQVLYETDSLTISSITKICEVRGRDQSFKFLFFKNKTSSPLSFSFERHIYRNGECSTCNNLNKSEFTFQMTLEGDEELKGTCENIEDESLHVFDKFIKRVPGMTNTSVTDIKFENFIYN